MPFRLAVTKGRLLPSITGSGVSQGHSTAEAKRPLEKSVCPKANLLFSARVDLGL